MSYHSRFEVRILDDHHKDFSVHTIGLLRRMSGEAKACIDEYGSVSEAGQWYDIEKDLCTFTRQNPGLLLQVTRWGQDRGDIVRTYYLNGRLEHVAAIVTFPPFNERELKSP